MNSKLNLLRKVIFKVMNSHLRSPSLSVNEPELLHLYPGLGVEPEQQCLMSRRCRRRTGDSLESGIQTNTKIPR